MRSISIKIYLIILFIAVVAFGSLLYQVEGDTNLFFKDIPSSILWVTMALLGGGIGNVELSVSAKLLVVGIQFTSLLLFGLLIAIVGQSVERRLLGSSRLDK